MLLAGVCLATLDQKIILLQHRRLLLPPLPVPLGLHLVLPGVPPLVVSSLFEKLIKVLMPANSSSDGQLYDLRLVFPLLAQS